MPEPVAPEAASRMQGRAAFWIDDAILDTYAPVLGRFACGTAALAVYTALARRADRDGGSWPSLRTLAEQAATSERTVQRALQLLEALGLVAVTTCFDGQTQRQTSNRYTLLTPPPVPPVLDPDPAQWPTPVRRTLRLPARALPHAVADARQEPTVADFVAHSSEGEPAPLRADTRQVAARDAEPGSMPVERHLRQPSPATFAPVEAATPRQADTLPPASQSPRPRQPVTPSPVTVTPQEGHPREVIPVKENDDGRFSRAASFAIAEVGLSSGQVWAATLAELARGRAVSATELEAWLRPAALSGREGATLLLGAPSAVARDRIAARHLPAVRAALARVLGTPLPVRVVVMDQPVPEGRYPGIGTRPPPNEWNHGLAGP